MNQIQQALTSKVAGMPGYVWVIIAAGGLFLVSKLRSPSGAAPAQTPDQATAQGLSVNLPDANAFYTPVPGPTGAPGQAGAPGSAGAPGAKGAPGTSGVGLGPVVVGTNPVPGGFGIWQWVNGRWQDMKGGGVDVTVRGNEIWAVNNKQEIWRWSNGTWTKQPGAARAIGGARPTGNRRDVTFSHAHPDHKRPVQFPHYVRGNKKATPQQHVERVTRVAEENGLHPARLLALNPYPREAIRVA